MNSEKDVKRSFIVNQLTNNFDFKLNIGTFNTRGQADNLKRRKQFIWTRQTKLDICFYQETHCTKEQHLIRRNQYGGPMFCSHGNSNSKGAAILLRKNLGATVLEEDSDKDGRIVWIKIKYKDASLALCSIYAPNDEKGQISFFNKLKQFLEKKQERGTYTILGGDFNCVRNPEKDRNGKGETSQRTKVNAVIDAILADCDLVDSYRVKYPWSREYTWIGPNSKSRLDMIFIPASFAQMTKLAKITHGVGSDHCAYIIGLEGEKFIKRGPGVWRLNTQILEERDYENVVKTSIREAIELAGEDADERHLWEDIKMFLEHNTQVYCKKRAKNRRELEDKLTKRLNKLEQTLHHLKTEEVQEYYELKKQLEQIYDQKAEAAILRSKVRWNAQGEKGTKYFFGLEKRNFTNQCIYQIQKEDGEIITNHEEIQKEINRHYEQLYSAPTTELEESELQEFLSDPDIPCLTKEQAAELERPITPEEIKAAVFAMSNQKAPGLDGIPVEFYKKFWHLIGQHLVGAVLQVFDLEGLGSSQRRGIIRLLPKPGRNLLSLKNWRCIVMLNVDYKVCSSVLNNRLKKIIPDLISSEQTGFIKGRYIGQNIRIMLELAEHLKVKNKDGILISLDITAAFDTVRHDYLVDVLERFGLPEQFIQWIRVLYTAPHSQVINNGYTTHGFLHERGVRQGDVLSPTLFLLAAEILAIAIKKHEKIKGIDVNGKTLKTSQYADDTTLFLSDEDSILALKELLEKFGRISGLIVNQTKTQCTGLGAKASENKIVHGFKIAPNPVKVLGIWFAHDTKVMQDLNVGGKFEKMKNILNSWHARGLTIQGRILVLKALGLSQLIYALMNTTILDKNLKEINDFVWEFIWKGKRKARIRRNVLIQDYKEGGLKAPDIYSMHTALKYSWIPRLLNGHGDPWAQLTCKKLENIGGLEYLLECNYEVGKLNLTLENTFIEQVLLANEKVNQKQVSTKAEICRQKLNHNKHILIGGKSFFFKILVDKNMDVLKHWFTRQGEPIQYNELQKKVGTKISWLLYLQIINAIPKSWKSIMKQPMENEEQVESQTWVPPKQAKVVLIKRQYTVPAGVRAWQKSTQYEPDDYDFWSETFQNIRRTTKESKLQVFQHKLIHRIIPTKKFLFRAKLTESPNCTSCDNTEETIEHLFWDCPTIRNIWVQLINLFNSVEEEELPNDNLALCMFGVYSRKPTIVRWNYVTLVLRFYVYKCRIQNLIPTMRAFKFVLKANLEILKRIALQNKTSKKFREEWSSWLEKL